LRRLAEKEGDNGGARGFGLGRISSLWIFRIGYAAKGRHKNLICFSFNNFGGDRVGGLGCGKGKFIIRTLAAVNGFRVGEI